VESETGFCTGCARTIDEIGAWPSASDENKRAIWRRLPPRRAVLGFESWRLPWTAKDLSCFLRVSLREGFGIWTLGLPGLQASFTGGTGAKVRVCLLSGAIIAERGNMAISLNPHEKAASFAYRYGERAEGLALGIAIPKGRVVFSPAPDLDSNAIRPADRVFPLEDLGLGCASVRAYLRRKTDTTDVIVETGLGRMELHNIDENGLRRLRKGLDLTGRTPGENVPGWELQPIYLPCAQFLPTSAKHSFVLE
jgi:hypothetical protein